jgi:hypothetical protein
MKLVILMCLSLVLVVGCRGMSPCIDSNKPVSEPVLESFTNHVSTNKLPIVSSSTNQVYITNQLSIVSTNDSNSVAEKVNSSKFFNSIIIIIVVLIIVLFISLYFNFVKDIKK